MPTCGTALFGKVNVGSTARPSTSRSRSDAVPHGHRGSDLVARARQREPRRRRRAPDRPVRRPARAWLLGHERVRASARYWCAGDRHVEDPHQGLLRRQWSAAGVLVGSAQGLLVSGYFASGGPARRVEPTRAPGLRICLGSNVELNCASCTCVRVCSYCRSGVVVLADAPRPGAVVLGGSHFDLRRVEWIPDHAHLTPLQARPVALTARLRH